MKRTAILTADEVTFRNGLRLTTVVRTLGDLGQSAGPDLVERALECALRSHLVEIADIDTWLAARPDQRWPGATTLRGVLERRGRVVPPTESDAETLFAQLARVHEAEPFRQHDVWHGDQWVGRADFFFPVGRGLAIEVDGYATHGTPAALQYDLSRQNGVVLADHAVLRFTWADIARRPATTWRVVDQKLRALAAEAGLRANHESPAPDDRRRGYSSSSMDDKRPSRTTTG